MSYKFTMDFNCGGGSFTNINHIIKTYGIPNGYAEVGVFEGATVFWLSDTYTQYNAGLQLYAIDPHVGSVDMSEDFNVIQSNFTNNLNASKYANVEYINKYSSKGLLDLINNKTKVELIYIDGDHRASEVLTDLVLAWQIIPVGGVILCDDTGAWRYTDNNGTQSAQMCPRMAVEMFMQCNWHKIQIINLPDSSQTAFRKIAE